MRHSLHLSYRQIGLLVPSVPAKLALLALLGLLNSGWCPLPKAALYPTLPGQSGLAIDRINRAAGRPSARIIGCRPAMNAQV